MLEGQRLQERTQATLGDTLDSLPGIRADTFGGGSTRPVIRGQNSSSREGAVRQRDIAGRLRYLAGSRRDRRSSSSSTESRFCAVPPPCSHGSGAIGGVVNVLDKKIPTTLPSRAFEGAVGLRGATVSSEEAAMAEFSARAGEHLVFHPRGTTRDADDYRVPDFEDRRAIGTRARSSSGSAGVSFVGDDGYLGLAYSYRDDDYGLPGHNHEFEGCHPHGSTLHRGSHDAGRGRARSRPRARRRGARLPHHRPAEQTVRPARRDCATRSPASSASACARATPTISTRRSKNSRSRRRSSTTATKPAWSWQHALILGWRGRCRRAILGFEIQRAGRRGLHAHHPERQSGTVRRRAP